jgi:hypothetical protein
MKVLKAIGFANGVHCPHEGQYLKYADFDAYDGRGFMTFTKKASDAMTFPDFRAAMVFWQTTSKARPRREDGMPNRPLTALTIEIEDAP